MKKKGYAQPAFCLLLGPQNARMAFAAAGRNQFPRLAYGKKEKLEATELKHVYSVLLYIVLPRG